MSAPVLPPRAWCPAAHPWVSQPRPTVRPEWCAYCGQGPASIRCGPEHTAYTGEWLCPCCYRRLFEGPVLFSRHEARHV